MNTSNPGQMPGDFPSLSNIWDSREAVKSAIVWDFSDKWKLGLRNSFILTDIAYILQVKNYLKYFFTSISFQIVSMKNSLWVTVKGDESFASQYREIHCNLQHVYRNKQHNADKSIANCCD